MVEYQRRGDDARRARGRPVATLGPSPGFREERLKPVYVGDTVTYATEVIERASIAGPAGSNVDPQQRGQSKDEP
jgi:acyl dehydratase